MTGNRTLDRILLITSAVVTLAATGLVIYSHLYIKAPPIDQEQEIEKLKKQSMAISNSAPLELKRVILNLPSRHTRLRYLEIQVNLETFHPEQKEFLTAKEYVIYDALIKIAGAMDPTDLNSVTGKILLEGRLKNYLNENFKDDVIKKIYFSKFVVQ